MQKNLVSHRTVEYKTWVFDFENGFLYVQNWANNRLQDDFFVHSGDLYPDGKVRPNCKKYFYSPFDPPETKKEVGVIKSPSSFKWFDRLFYVDESGEVKQINH